MALAVASVVAVALLLVQLVEWAAGISVLLIGDSVDRYISVDWCWLMGIRDDGKSTTAWDNLWGSSNLRYGRGKKFPAYICGVYATNDTLAFLHHYGAKDKGPYHNGFANNPNDPNTDSELRIPYGLDLYIKDYPVPDRIVYHSALWDIAALTTVDRLDPQQLNTPGSSLYNAAIETYTHNMNSRVDQLLNITRQWSIRFNKPIDIALRTAPSNPLKRDYTTTDPIESMGALLHAFNGVIREISIARNLTLFDLDKDTWSHVQFNYSRSHEIMRDYVHPNAIVTGPAGSKIIGFNYSRYFHMRDRKKDFEPRIWLSPALHEGESPPKRVANVVAVRYEPKYQSQHHHASHVNADWANPELAPMHENALNEANANEVYLLTSNRCGVHRVGHYSFAELDQIHLGLSSILPLKHEQQLESIPLLPSRPSSNMFIKTENDGKYYITSGDCYSEIAPLSNLSLLATCSFLNVSYTSEAESVHVVKASECQSLLDYYRPCTPVPNAFREGVLFRIHTERAVFYVKNATKHMIFSLDAFVRMGFDFSDVHVIDNSLRRYTDCLRQGEDVV